MQGVRKMYLAVGIPSHLVEGYYVPLLKMFLYYLDYYLDYQFCKNTELQIKKDVPQQCLGSSPRLIDNYLKNVKMIIYGSNNRAMGHKLFISTDNMIVKANNTFIYNNGSSASNNRVTGKNIMRTKRYEINFDQLEAIRRGQITKGIKIVR